MRAWSKVDRARWDRVRRKVLERDGWACRSCGRRGRLEVDHIEPMESAEEFDYNPDNLQALCRSCHFDKTGRENSRRRGTSGPERAAWAEMVEEMLDLPG